MGDVAQFERSDGIMKSPRKIVIFDYSGTLSIEAPRFGRTENLVRALSETGLASLGVATPEIFWGEIVAPTWSEGSTTAAGYRNLMAAKVRALQRSTDVPKAEIDAACARFVDRYLAHSRIDPHWRPLLSRLTATPEACGIVATDHYAEATGTILGFLSAWGIPAAALAPSEKMKKGGTALDFRSGAATTWQTPTSPSGVGSEASVSRGAAGVKNGGVFSCLPWLVVNSADLGFWKADRRFWETLRSRIFPEAERRVMKEGGDSLPFPEAVRGVLIVDDFGFNEEAGDLYGQREKVMARRETTAGLLHSVFDAEVEVVPFFLEGAERNSPEAWSRRIEEASAKIDLFLEWP